MLNTTNEKPLVDRIHEKQIAIKLKGNNKMEITSQIVVVLVKKIKKIYGGLSGFEKLITMTRKSICQVHDWRTKF